MWDRCTWTKRIAGMECSLRRYHRMATFKKGLDSKAVLLTAPNHGGDAETNLSVQRICLRLVSLHSTLIANAVFYLCALLLLEVLQGPAVEGSVSDRSNQQRRGVIGERHRTVH